MKRVLAGALLAVTASYGSAIEFGTGIWQQSVGGSLNDGAVTMNSLGLEGSNDLYFYATVDMPLIIPNLKIRSQALTASGSGTFNPDDLNGYAGMSNLPNSTQSVNTALDLSYWDVVAHYGLPLPVMDVDFGLNLRMINGSIALKNGVIDESGDLTLPIPMLHAAVGMPLPANLSVYGEYNLLPLQGVNVTDFMVKARYVLPVPTLIVDLGIEVGYHDFTIAITDPTDMISDINSKGFFVGVAAEF